MGKVYILGGILVVVLAAATFAGIAGGLVAKFNQWLFRKKDK